MPTHHQVATINSSGYVYYRDVICLSRDVILTNHPTGPYELQSGPAKVRPTYFFLKFECIGKIQ